MEEEYSKAKVYAIHKRELLRIPIIGITGSIGKTTMKEMIATLLSEEYPVASNEGSRNIAETMVLNILSIRPEHRAGVFEFGVDAPGQMEEMVAIAKPGIPVFTGISEVHLTGFQTLDAIYKEKSKLLLTLPKGGIVIANGEDAHLMDFLWKDDRISKEQIITYGFTRACTVYADEVRSLGINGMKAVIHAERLGLEPFEITTKLLGKHTILQMVGAITVALLFHGKVEKLRSAVQRMEAVPHRMQLLQTDVFTVIDDTYNASVISMKAALETLRDITKRRRVAILGDMLELGDYSAEAHKLVGSVAFECADVIISVGKEGRIIYHQCRSLEEEGSLEKEIYYFPGTKELIDGLRTILRKEDVILCKASHQMRFDEVVDRINVRFGLAENKNNKTQ